MSSSSTPPIITVNDVRVEKGGREIVRPCQLKIHPRRITTIIGPNGAGKTSLMRLISGLDAPTGGRVEIGELVVSRATPAQLARQRSVLLQRQHQHFDYTVLEYLLMGVHHRLSRWALPGKAHLDRAMHALERVEMSSMSKRAITSLSAGEYQRMQLARLMLTQAPWWMLDEPLSNVDLKHQRIAMAHMKAQCTSGGVLMIMHDLNLVMRYSDDVILMKQGEVVASGAKEHVCTISRLSEVFDVDLTVHRDGDVTFWSVSDTAHHSSTKVSPDDDEQLSAKAD